MNVSLSIDWDFFFNFNPYNWVYAENKFFKTYVWDLRLLMQPELVKEFIPVGYKEFWQKLREKQLMPTIIYVAEHHLYAYHMFRDTVKPDLILHFDNHSDMSIRYYKKIDSGNWLLELMRLRPELRVIWVKPDHGKGEKITKTIGVDKFKQLHWREFHSTELPEINVLPSYICRSGAYTPPWSDKEFKNFLKESKEHIIPLIQSPVNERQCHLRGFKGDKIDKVNVLLSIFRSNAAKLGLEAVKSVLKAAIGTKGTKREPVV